MRIYEVDARVWLAEASRRERRPVTLGSIPSSDIDRILDRGFDCLWLRGVWERDPAALDAACRSAPQLEAMRELLPDLELEDIDGPPFEGLRHEIRADLGGEEAFEVLREDLARRGVRVLLDFSPRAAHLPPDGKSSDLERVAALSDGVCLLDDVAREPELESRCAAWQKSLERVRSIHPRFLVLAGSLLAPVTQLTADGVLDDGLHDALAALDALWVRERLRAGAGSSPRPIRYLERHGERRARDQWDGPSHFAASVIAYLSPGILLFEDGQVEGRRLAADSRLLRRRDEALDEEVEAFHESLFDVLSRTDGETGAFSVPPVLPAWRENATHEQFVVTLREGTAGARILVAVNFGPIRGQCYVDLSALEAAGRGWLLQDLLSLAAYQRDGDELASRGLFLDLAPWDYNVFEVRAGERC